MSDYKALGDKKNLLLGRKYEPDLRDWSVPYLHNFLSVDDSKFLNQTVEEALNTNSFFSSWTGLLAFWRWLKNWRKPKPVPTDPHPAWVDPIQLDQGQTGHCVGFAWAGWGDTAPIFDNYRDEDGHLIYYECKVIDKEPNNEDGTTVRSGATAMRNRGKLLAYAFAADLKEVDDWLDNHGPVVFGTDWYDGMFDPDRNGYIKPTGSLAGGHAYLCIDKLNSEDAYLFQNSWGSGWGLNGRFKMKTSDVEFLLNMYGEACCAAEIG